MGILLLGQQKGGCGKSTLACNIAAMISARGGDVLLLDADRQGSASGWCVDRKFNYPDAPKVTSVQAFGDLTATLTDIAPRYGFVIIDTAGRDSEELRSSLTVCDTILIPVKPGAFDLAALFSLVTIVKQSRLINPTLKAYSVLSIAPTNPKGAEILQAREAINGYQDIVQLSTMVCDRKIYRDSITVGLSVNEVKPESNSIKQAQQEIINLVNILTEEIQP